MNDRAVSVFDNYDIEIIRTARGRGALLAQTPEGWVILKEYTGPEGRLPMQEQLLAAIRDSGFSGVEQLVRSREGELVSRDQDQTPYIVKTWSEGRECNLRDVKECQNAVKALARLHQAMELPELAAACPTPPFCLENEYARHNRELKKVRRYLRGKGQKTDFERCLFHHYDFFYEKALAAAEMLEAEQIPSGGRGSFCHGDFQHHNLINGPEGFTFINFEKYILDNPVRDLYLFLRKLLEKNNWSSGLGLSVITAYDALRSLDEGDRKQLYYRFAYPEKFWKIVNFYYNNGKAWIPGRNREKLENLLRQEAVKEAFLESTLK